jgi:hypothetical protein
MLIKLLPASVNPVDPSQTTDVSNRLVPVAQRAIITRAGQTSLVPPAAVFAWSSRTRQGGVNWIKATLVEDSQREETGRSGWEYVSGWAWSFPVERTAIAQYLFYAAAATPANGRGHLIDVYA